MHNAINFIKERRKLLTQKRVKDKRVLFYTTLGFAGLVVILTVLIGTNLVLARQVKQVKQSQQRLDQAIQSNQRNDSRRRLLIEKLKITAELFGERKNKQEALVYFSSLFSPDIKVSGINYESGSKKLAFTLDVPSVFELDGVLQVLESDELKQRFGQVEKSGLSRQQNGHYIVNVAIILDRVTTTK